MARLILVSNRVTMPSADKSQRAGGLEVALAPVLKNIDSVWFGWSGEVVDADKVKTHSFARSRRRYVVTDLSEEDHQEYYSGFDAVPDCTDAGLAWALVLSFQLPGSNRSTIHALIAHKRRVKTMTLPGRRHPHADQPKGPAARGNGIHGQAPGF